MFNANFNGGSAVSSTESKQANRATQKAKRALSLRRECFLEVLEMVFKGVLSCRRFDPVPGHLKAGSLDFPWMQRFCCFFCGGYSTQSSTV
jgi:hypothetical protein